MIVWFDSAIMPQILKTCGFEPQVLCDEQNYFLRLRKIYKVMVGLHILPIDLGAELGVLSLRKDPRSLFLTCNCGEHTCEQEHSLNISPF